MDAAIVCSGLTKRYGRQIALDNLDLEISKGEVFGYLGPNGAGKTTTIHMLLGLTRPTSGAALIMGQDAQTQTIRAHTHLAYVPGETILWPTLTGAETLRLLGNLRGGTDEVYQTELIRRFQFDPDKRVRKYSKGNRQKISLIAALAARAEVLILDEPTSGLDPLMEKVFREAVLEAKANGQTVFLSSHILEEVETLCDRVGVLRDGRLIETGTLAELRHLSAVTVEATFAGPPPKVQDIQGVSQVEVSGHRLRCHVQGSVDRLMQRLAAAHPQTLLSHEPSLEELFLSLYGDTAKAER